jgi:hypothetical protein
VLKTSRSVGDPTLKMERAYVNKDTGRVACCWQADDRDQIANLFKQAGVAVESISMVDETVETDFV